MGMTSSGAPPRFEPIPTPPPVLRPAPRRRGWPAALAGLLCSATPCVESAADAPSARRYELVTEIGMPNLDENLRYATTRQARCLDTGDLARAFSMLGDVSLQDCRLVAVTQRDESATYALQCTGGHGTTGEAQWQFDQTSIAGTLNVRLGGKNMTFYQRITGRAVGACQGP